MTGEKAPIYAQEDAPWFAVRDPITRTGSPCSRSTPGHPGGHTSMHVTYYAVNGARGGFTVVDRCTLTRPRGPVDQM